jgi:drug/metabolite transporter (DMT)-like permease
VSLWYSLPIGAFTYATYMLALKSLVTGYASVNVTTFRLNFVLSSMIAVVFLGEALTTRKLLCMLLCLAAIAVFFLGSRREESAHARNTGLPFALLACACMAGLNTLNKLALNAGSSILQLVMYRYVIVCAIGIASLVLRRQSAVPSRKLLASSAVCAVLSFLFLKEKMNVMKAAGIVMAVISIVAIG